MNTELCKIAYKYGTDKCPEIHHPYTPFYYEFLKDKQQSIKKVLELGVGYPINMPWSQHYRTGASLYMWRDFFPNAQIYGADILPETVFRDDRIEVLLCDERNKKDLEALIEKTGSDIDLFIDDGSHAPKHQIFACLTLMPLLKKGVIYIIEDVTHPGTLKRALSEYDCYIPDLTHIQRRRRNRLNDDLIMIVKNK